MKKISEISQDELDAIASIMISKPTKCFDTYRDGEYVTTLYKREALDWQPGTTIEMSITLMYNGENLQVYNNWNYHHAKGVSTTQESLHNFSQITVYLISKGYLQDVNGYTIDDIGAAWDSGANYVTHRHSVSHPNRSAYLESVKKVDGEWVSKDEKEVWHEMYGDSQACLKILKEAHIKAGQCASADAAVKILLLAFEQVDDIENMK